MIRVIAIAQGFDNVALREIGDEFDMPDHVFERRPKLDEKGQPIPGQFHEPPSWFEPIDRSERERVEKERAEVRKVNRVPAIDLIRQQAEATADARRLAQAQEAVRQEDLAKQETENRKAVDTKFKELKGRSTQAGSDPRDTRGAENRTADAKRQSSVPSPDALNRGEQAQSDDDLKKP
jgi:hypothetical protein